jgi:hypothetical protein
MDLTSTILWVIVIWIISQIILGAIDGYQMVKIQERVTVLKKLSDMIHKVKVETVNDVEYWYDADDDAFLAQGRTLDEVINVIKSRFPDHIFLVEEKGGLAAQTGWKLMPAEEFQKLPLDIKNI